MSYINNKEPNTSKETVSIFDLIRKKKKKIINTYVVVIAINWDI